MAVRCKPSPAQRLLLVEEMLGCSFICPLSKKGEFGRNFCFIDPTAEQELPTTGAAGKHFC